MAENMDVEFGIAAPSLTVRMLFPLPVSAAVILNSLVGQRQKMSGNVASVISKSGLVENVGLTVEIVSLVRAVQTFLPLPF